ncbi:hypothetical protein [Nitratireductor basaltis]|uniref:Uncharacterized protein n=1 Tax=Nitratireductor basaltis TaxID=472175 RepID=A0A084U9X2_9HYPH|nr:hypothetical protein [Nitratireductor basaltis]KFB09758.1 hypothetical protein EL18_00777 [Nitratireductor basaltis]
MNQENKARGLDKPADELRETDLANRKMGDNDLKGNDQANVRNQRHAQPDAKREADDVIESFEKLDKDVRAREDLGKGNRESPAGD